MAKSVENFPFKIDVQYISQYIRSICFQHITDNEENVFKIFLFLL